jgi:hypothetical protein
MPTIGYPQIGPFVSSILGRSLRRSARLGERQTNRLAVKSGLPDIETKLRFVFAESREKREFALSLVVRSVVSRENSRQNRAYPHRRYFVGIARIRKTGNRTSRMKLAVGD